jgi:predicted transcriptional regulator
MPRPRSSAAARRRVVPEAELDVLSALRRSGEATASDLGRALAANRPLAHASVVTLLMRLEARGLVARRRGETGKAFVYRATPRAETALRDLIDSLVARVFGGDRVGFVASFLESGPPSRDEAARLRALLGELERRGRAR